MNVPFEILNKIADNMEAGDKCFIHKKTLELITYPDDYLLDMYSEDDEEILPWKEVIEKVSSDPDSYIEIEKMYSSRSYEVMEEFIDSLENSYEKIRLMKAIIGKKPFANFKFQIDNCGVEREMWFKFRREKNIEWVRKQLEDDFTDEIEEE